MTAARVPIPDKIKPAMAVNYGPRLQTMRKRAEFLRLRGGARWAGAAFVLEGKPRSAALPMSGARFGFTITKKIGKAHERNRIRRRLSHALRAVVVPHGLQSWDMVIVARPQALTMSFERLRQDFSSALARLARPPTSPSK